MQEIKSFKKLQGLTIFAPYPSLLIHEEIKDAIQGKSILEVVNITYESNKIFIDSTSPAEGVIDFFGASKALEDQFFDCYVEAAKRAI